MWSAPATTTERLPEIAALTTASGEPVGSTRLRQLTEQQRAAIADEEPTIDVLRLSTAGRRGSTGRRPRMRWQRPPWTASLVPDRVLRNTADAVRASLRSYDLLVRFDGDEFVCGLVDMTVTEARARFADANAVLTASDGICFTVGLAEQRPPELVAEAIVRADSDLYRQRTVS